MLIALDGVMIIDNPFSGLGTAGPDPISVLTEVGGVMWEDMVALGLRGTLLIIGAWMILRVFNEFIDYGALAQTISGSVS